MKIEDVEGYVVKLSEPLPCSIWAGTNGICNRPTLTGYLEPDPRDPGAWKLRPVCRACDEAAAALYSDTLQRHRPGGRAMRPAEGTYQVLLDFFEGDRVAIYEWLSLVKTISDLLEWLEELACEKMEEVNGND